MPKAKGGFYAVKKGRVPGVYGTWDECTEQVKGYAGAAYKKFADLQTAQEWIAAPAVGRTSATGLDKTGETLSKSIEVQPVGGSSLEEAGWDVVYTDGACKGNGKVGAIAGVGVWWGKSDPRNLSERCPGDPTNNRAELTAIIRVFETTQVSRKPLWIKTDSSYAIDCFERFLPKWLRNGFRTAKGGGVKNLGPILYLAALLKERGMAGQKVKLQHVRGHSGINGNENADVLAVAGCRLPEEPERDWGALTVEVEERMLKMDMSGAKEMEIKMDGKVMAVTEEDVDPSIYEDMILDDEELAEMGRTGDFDKY